MIETTDLAGQERAAEARHGGRYITHALAKTLLGWDSNPALRAAFAGEDGPEKLAEIWRYTASPSGAGYGTSGRDTTAASALRDARVGGVEWAHSAYWLAPTLPESAFDWPIYRAGMLVRSIEALASDEFLAGDSVWINAQDIGNALNLWPTDG